VPETLRFHKSFYAKAGLDAAAEAYAAFAEIAVAEEDDEYVALITPNDDAHRELIEDHFGNHALFASLACQVEGL